MNETTEQRTNGNAFRSSDEIIAAWNMPADDHPLTKQVLTPTEQHSQHSEHPSEQVSTQATAQVLTKHTPRRSLIRMIPPVAALGAAFCLQVIAVSDVLGGSLSKQMGSWGYLIGALFGLAVASTCEGGAAYLMDLYDKHMLAGDSTWSLKLSMLVYVGASAAALHWWAAMRQIPGVVPWLLAAMSAAALYLWSRGSRWDHREHMRATGQIDRALPRLSVSAKSFHPFRYLITLYLITWDQVSSTDEARARYAEWKQHRKQEKARRKQCAGSSAQDLITEQPIRVEVITPEQAPAQRIEQMSTQEAISAQSPTTDHVSTESDQDAEITAQTEQRTQTRTISVTEQITEHVSTTTGKASIEQLAHTLAEAFRDQIPGRPKALGVLRAEYGSCSEPRAKQAIRMLAEMREQEAITDHPTTEQGVRP